MEPIPPPSLPALPARLTVPESRRLVARPRLEALIDAPGGATRAVWVLGPPGAGKTSLVARWVGSRAGRTFWYRCDRQDLDPSGFFHHLARATSLPGNAQPIDPLAGPVAIAKRSFRLLAAADPPRVWVFDDCHELADDGPLFAVIREAMAELPADCRFVFTSRRSPPAAWARDLLNGELALVGPESLPFDQAEAEALAGAPAGDSRVAEVLRRTGGWAAGLTLLLSGSRPSGAARGPEDRQALFDYFASEVFASLAPDVRRLLLDVALFPVASGAMAAEASGTAGADARLQELARDRLFVDVLPGDPPGYRLHDLFRAFLLERRAALLPAAERQRQAEVAARLLIGAGQVEEAVALLIDHRAWAAAAGLLRERARQLLASGRHRSLADWISAIPPDERAGDGWLDAWLGQALLALDPAAAREAFTRAAACFDRSGEQAGRLAAWSGRVESWVAEWNEVGPLRPLVAEGEALLAAGPPPTPEIGARVAVGMFAALLYSQPDHPGLDAWAEQVRAIALAAPDPGTRLEVGAHLLIFQTWWRGDLASAAHLADALGPLERDAAAAPHARVIWCAMLAGYQWMVADTDRALATVERGLALGDEHGVAIFDVLLHAQGAFASLAAGRIDTARRHLAGMASRLGSQRRLDALLYHYLAAWEAMASGDVNRAAGHGQAARVDVEASGSPFHTANALVCAGLLHRRLGDPVEAERAHRQALAMARGAGNRAVEYQALLHLASAALDAGDRVAGSPLLAEALSLARRQGFRSHAFWSDEEMSRRYADALGAGIETDYVLGQIRFRRLPPPPLANEPRWPWRFRFRGRGQGGVERDGVAIPGSASGKGLELLETLVDQGGRAVPVARLVDALWPDADGDQGRRSFDTTLHRLRKLLGDDDALRLEGGMLSLAEGMWHVARPAPGPGATSP